MVAVDFGLISTLLDTLKVPAHDQAVLMDLHPLWMLAPWAVFALAAGIKFWRITAVFRKRGLERDSSTERLRKTLERIWAKQA
jgi:Na+/H+ antiporter NhaC